MAGLSVIGYMALLSILFLNICSAKKPRAKETIGSLRLKLNAQNNKIKAINKEIEGIKEKLEMVDEAQGVLENRPACRIKNKNHTTFYYEESLGSCYSIEANTLMLNSTQAETFCKRKNGHLVSIETKKEQDFLEAMWKNAYGISTLSRFLTSGILKDGDWEWEATGKKFKYENWIPTTSHNDENFSCLSLLSSENYYWVDVACWAPSLVTCEISDVSNA